MATTIDVAVRSPTHRAWALVLVSLIAGGEALHGLQKPGNARFFDLLQLEASELVLLTVVAALSALASSAWLVSLYLRPGRLLIDPGAGILRRESRPFFCSRVAEGPLSAWVVRLVFYSLHQRRQGSFKRLELRGPHGYEDFLLFSDVRQGEELAKNLEQLHGAIGLEVVVQNEASPKG